MEYRFLWAELQLKSICAQVSDYGIEETLQHTPRDIDTTYERILDMIDKKPPAQRELARKALLFIAYATEPVSIDILALAIAVKGHTQSLDVLRSSLSTKDTIIDTCGNLLSVDSTDSNFQRVCFIHFSVHEFLINYQSKLMSRLLHTLSLEPEVAHREIARMCMNFLLILYSQLQDYCTDIESSFVGRYISRALPHHLLAGNLNSLPSHDEMINLTLLFFEKSPPMFVKFDSIYGIPIYVTFSPSVLALVFNLPGTYQYYNPQALYGRQLDQKLLTWVYGKKYQGFLQVFNNRLAMHYAVGCLDSVPAAERLYTYKYPIEYVYNDSDGLLFDTTSTQGERVLNFFECTPLYRVRSEGVARFLLDKGASMDPQVKFPNLLVHLSHSGDTKIIQLLLDRNPELDEDTQKRVLESLAHQGNIEAIQLLLKYGVDIHAQGGEALESAARNGKVEAMQLLLDEGVDINAPTSRNLNALLAAASDENVESMRFLLDKGADVNAQCRERGSALQVASWTGNIEAVQLLLDKGADVNAQGGDCGNALQVAACHGVAARDGDIKAMLLLLDKGADVNAQGGYYGNALQAAACYGNIEAMLLILDKGADVNVQGGYYGNALQGAAHMGHVEAIQLLLDTGADVNAQGGYHGSALQAAASRGHVEAIQLLLDYGADVNAQGGYNGSALQAAASWGDVEVIQLLLDYGVDVNAQGGYHGSALQAAASRGHVEAIQLLLDYGADVNAQGGYYGSALQAAAPWGDIEAIQLLLDYGADVNAQGGYHGSALQAAAYWGNVKVIQLLLDNGADVNTQGGKYGSALQAATSRGHVKAKKLLLDNGAR